MPFLQPTNQNLLELKGWWTEKSNFPWAYDIYEVITL